MTAKEKDFPYTTKTRIFRWLHHIVVPVFFVLIVFLFFHSRAKFELYSDEGVNLIKALLVEQGYVLYDEIWSDQPPLLTNLLAIGLHFLGVKVGVARSIIFLMSLGLLWAVFEFMALHGRKTYAYAAAFLVFLLPNFLSLSLSVMVGLPSITFAMGSLFCLALWHRKHQGIWLILSAILLSLGVLTKLMMGMVAPVFGLGILIEAYTRFRTTRNWRDLIVAPGLWGGVFVLCLTAGLFFLVGFENLEQLVGDHLSAAESVVYAADPSLRLNYYLQDIWPFLLLASIGSMFVLSSHRWVLLYLTGWVVTAYLLLFNHLPVWFHHQMYVTIPAAMLGGIAVVEGLNLFRLKNLAASPKHLVALRSLALIGTLSLGFVLPRTDPFEVLSWPPSLDTTGLEVGARVELVLGTMSDYASQTQWVFTDLPMFAFRARLPVPPELAVITDKRLQTGYLTEEEILVLISHYQPEQILLGRFTFTGLDEYLTANYQLMVRKEDILKLYLRNDLVP